MKIIPRHNIDNNTGKLPFSTIKKYLSYTMWQKDDQRMSHSINTFLLTVVTVVEVCDETSEHPELEISKAK